MSKNKNAIHHFCVSVTTTKSLVLCLPKMIFQFCDRNEITAILSALSRVRPATSRNFNLNEQPRKLLFECWISANIWISASERPDVLTVNLLHCNVHPFGPEVFQLIFQIAACRLCV